MGERAKVILNEYSAKSLLMRDSLDLDKFYNSDLKLLIKAAKEEIKRYEELIIKYDNELNILNNKINKSIKYAGSNDFIYDPLYLKKEKLFEMLEKK